MGQIRDANGRTCIAISPSLGTEGTTVTLSGYIAYHDSGTEAGVIPDFLYDPSDPAYQDLSR